MAIFNPPVPGVKDDSPSYFGLSRPISGFAGDQSAQYQGQAYGSLFKGLGDVFSGIATGADYIVKDSIDDKVRKLVEGERSSYTDALEVVSGRKPNPIPYATSLLPKTDKAPEELDRSLEGVRNLHTARGAGKVRPTEYLLQLMNRAKEIRSEYGPGYYDYIDSKISSITGVTPANAYIQQLQETLNDALTNRKSEQAKALEFVKQRSGYEDAPFAAAMVESGRWGPVEVMQWAYKRDKQRADWADNTSRRADEIGGRAEVARQTEDAINKEIAGQVGNFIENFEFEAAGVKTTKDIAKIIEGIRTGDIKMNDVNQKQIQQYGLALMAHRDKIRENLWIKFNTKLPDGTTAVTRLGENGLDKALNLINKHMFLFDQYANAIQKGDLHLAAMTSDYLKANKDDNIKRAINDPDMERTWADVQVIKELGGDEMMKSYFTYGLGKGLDEKWRIFLRKEFESLSAQTDVRKKNATNPKTLNDVANRARELGLEDAKTVDEMVRLVERVYHKDTPPEIRKNLAAAAFHPRNFGFISKFVQDSINADGTSAPGSSYVYTKMTSPEMTKAMKEMGPEAWSMYVNWAKLTYKSELFSNEIKHLETIQANKNIVIGWDTVNNRFLPPKVVGTDRFTNFYDIARIKTARDSINRLNMGLHSLSNIAKETGEDVDVFLLKSLIEMGFKPGAPFKDTLPEHMLRAIMGGRSGKDSIISPHGTTPYTPEDQFPTVEESVRNPTRGMKPYVNKNISKTKDQDRVPAFKQAPTLPIDEEPITPKMVKTTREKPMRRKDEEEQQ